MSMICWTPPSGGGRSGPMRRSLGRAWLASWNDIEGIYQDPRIGRNRVLADHLDRQRMGPGGQASYREVGVLGSFRLGVGIEVLDEGSIEEDAGDPALGAASADPADPGPGEGDGRLRAEGIGFRGGPFAVRFVPVALNPAVAVRATRIRIRRSRTATSRRMRPPRPRRSARPRFDGRSPRSSWYGSRRRAPSP